jgi:hypothetical protein
MRQRHDDTLPLQSPVVGAGRVIEAHQLIYTCMRVMREQGFVIDQITLAEHLSRQKELEFVSSILPTKH